jgi:uncharacterized membrane protein
MEKNVNKLYKLFFMSLSVVLTIILITTFSSCTNTTDTLSNLDTVCFEKDVLPVFQTNCSLSGCHDGSGEGFKLTDYNSIREQVKPFNAKESKVYSAITSSWGEFMPPSPRQPLSKEQRTLIYVWIQQGAKNTSCQ